jgi:hypothetical protein
LSGRSRGDSVRRQCEKSGFIHCGKWARQRRRQQYGNSVIGFYDAPLVAAYKRNNNILKVSRAARCKAIESKDEWGEPDARVLQF